MGCRAVAAAAGDRERIGHRLLPSLHPTLHLLPSLSHLVTSFRWGLTAREPGAVVTLNVDTALGGLSLEAVQVGSSCSGFAKVSQQLFVLCCGNSAHLWVPD